MLLVRKGAKVKVGSSLSNPVTISLGVPQGSVLGPILFLVYLNSIFSLPFYGKVTAFADDLAIAYGSSNYLDLIAGVNKDVHLLRGGFLLISLLSVKNQDHVFQSNSKNLTRY